MELLTGDLYYPIQLIYTETQKMGQFWINTRMCANAQRDGRPAENRWRPLFNAAKFG